nr:MAG TPA: hypothetical protein [Caudoviricetes sp.]
MEVCIFCSVISSRYKLYKSLVESNIIYVYIFLYSSNKVCFD